MKYPKIYLAIDNCFASKRWTRPRDWIEIVKSLGITYVEASADNEIDPLYTTNGYLKDWANEVLEQGAQKGVKVANLYSGHGTYATLGLCHNDKRIRDKMQNEWLKPMMDNARSINAGMGFYCHAFSDELLQDKEKYNWYKNDLYSRLAELANYADSIGLSYIGIEQMYSPHQIPWTINSTKELLKSIYEVNKMPMYITLDTGHQSGQYKYMMPTEETIRQCMKTGSVKGVWLGTNSAYKAFENNDLKSVLIEIKNNDHLFSREEDTDTYHWIREFAAYSPIIHLQQTDGKSSGHLPFTKETNKNGIIKGEKLLQAIKESYENAQEKEMPPACSEIFLTLEMFAKTADINYDFLSNLKETVEYWRNFIPIDGLKL